MEKWRIIKKDGQDFSVSNLGNVKVLDPPIGEFIKPIKDFSLKGGQPYSRYLSIYGHTIHTLVAEAWLGPLPKGYVVNHKDGIKWNNNLSNLEIVTHSKNNKHAYENGLNKYRWKVDRKPKWFVLDEDELVIATIYEDSDMALFLAYHGLVLEGIISDTEKIFSDNKTYQIKKVHY